MDLDDAITQATAQGSPYVELLGELKRLRAGAEPTKPNPGEAYCQLLKCAQASVALSAKSDGDVADLLEDHVWAHMSVLDPKSEVVSSAIDRLRRSGGGSIPSALLDDDDL